MKTGTLKEPAELRRPGRTRQFEPLLIDVQAVAALLGCSTRHVHRLRDTGDMPAGVRVGRLLRWDRRQIEEWIAAGCPAARS
jgi:excisionase family DNA binding protein